MKYEGPIYGVGRNFNGRKIYFDTGRTSQEWDAMETKIVNLERENAALREVLNRWKEICEMGLPDVVMPSLKPALVDLWDATDTALDAARAKEGGAL